MAFLKQGGLMSMLKDGHHLYDEPVYQNIQACQQLAAITRTSLGPDGLNKLVINHIGKQFVTHDAHTILTQMEVRHPAANLMVMAARAMKDEIGDGTNLVVIFAGELLRVAEQLLRKGLHVADIVSGFTKAHAEALKLVPSFMVDKVEDLKDTAKVHTAILAAMTPKLPFHAAHVATLVTDACQNACPKDPKGFNVDSVRVSKLEGGSLSNSLSLHGFAIARDAEGSVKSKQKAKIVVYQCAVDCPSGETKGLVLLENAEQLKSVAASEETFVENMIKTLHDRGVSVIVSQQTYGDLALHYIEKYGMMAVKIMSNHDLKRLAAAVNAEVLASLTEPSEEDIGFVDEVAVEEYALTKFVIFRQLIERSRLSTILLRGPTSTILDDCERAVNDGINCFKALTRDPSLVAGGGAFETAMALRLRDLASTEPGLTQYAIRSYADAFLAVPRTLAEVSGLNANPSVDEIVRLHSAGQTKAGFSTMEKSIVSDTTAVGVVDTLLSKEWVIRLATDAALSILRVDQIIMSKPAGGPKGGGGTRDDDAA